MDYSGPLEVAIQAARQAGALLREDFHRSGGPRGSGGPAEMDEQAELVIKRTLLSAYPWNYLGEELGVEKLDRAGAGGPKYLWLVDPNDGTAAYLKGWRGSAVSIAALCDGIPVLGVVYAFGYPDDEGDLIAWAEGCPMTRNGQTITVDRADGSLDGKGDLPAVVFISQAADQNSTANAACVQPARYIRMPSIAYRLALVAAGEGVAAVSLNGPVGWDYAGGHALIRGASGILVDSIGRKVTYSASGNSSAGYCFGGSPSAVKELHGRDWKSVFTKSPHPASAPFSLTVPQRGKAISDPARLARAQGCLLGQLAGDSLGGLVEFRSEAQIRGKYPLGVRELADGGCWHNLAGQPTDDSEMALMLARTLARDGRYDPDAALAAYLHWWPLAWDRGSTLSQALGAASRGRTADERRELAARAASRESQSNGCLMRISPLGIFTAGIFAAADISKGAEWARLDCQLTHPHPVCQDACAVYVTAIAAAIAHGGSAQDCYQAALLEANRTGIQPSIVQALKEARESPPPEYSAQMGWVLIALQNAFYQLLHAPSLEEGVVDTVMRGGDTDTNAAIAGALLGAVHGRNGVPAQWTRALQSCRTLPESKTRHPQPEEFWPIDALELAERLLVGG